ncbi:hypothetical protein Fmac_025608 [Flemingia macrophylla]|uniref:Ycf15 n=1 Tax=Flemingia macrophylla TaxID=520843 RepID=A0ABD1LSP3_9FABA
MLSALTMVRLVNYFLEKSARKKKIISCPRGMYILKSSLKLNLGGRRNQVPLESDSTRDIDNQETTTSSVPLIKVLSSHRNRHMLL